MTSPDSKHDADAALDARIAALTRSAEPRQRVWTGIAERIRPVRRAGWPWAAAAAVVLALAIVALQPDRERSSTGSERALQLVQAEVEAMRRAAPVVTADWLDERPWTEAWADNQVAIDELEAALGRDPDNRLLLDFLAEARLRQARLIHAGLAHSPQTRMTL
ncbi:hypothetical protein HFP89_11795 [Wenzhouxiangella sp. XN79A]|uniref:hypothetical protein n=1 Tax=Wenzhouxiangella sp. XN79A TaxID=2724193 RepID=UPI00144AEF80|nr:hypothetical protein [Wenzhouxiangella sp. XN79A]NKI35846.1 hypothetical protein [Wenzhouxiangella sp. XN79A]